MGQEMALRLSKADGCSLESWLAFQYIYDLWHAKETTDLSPVAKVKFEAV